VAARDELLPQVRARLRLFTKAELMARLEQTGMPFAPIGKPEDLFDDPHLRASGGLMRTQLPGGGETRLPILPIEMDGARPVAGGALPSAGEHTEQVLREMGISESELRELVANGVVGP
jgi:crotonobetainyl-CoA:carnitine CoA-transferase CaiB-like acyl-CoA transferase